MKNKAMMKKLPFIIAASLLMPMVVSASGPLPGTTITLNQKMDQKGERRFLAATEKTVVLSETGPITQPEPPKESASIPETEPTTQTESTTDTEPTTDAEPTTDTEPTTDAEPTTDTEPATEIEPTTETEPTTQIEPPTQTEPAIQTEPQTESETNSAEKKETTNEELIKNQGITSLPGVLEDFRFVTVEKEPAVVYTKDIFVYEGKDEATRKVGSLKKDGLCYVLKEEKEWMYVESGVVRGFVQKKELLMGEEAKKRMAEMEQERISYSIHFKDTEVKKEVKKRTEIQKHGKEQEAQTVQSESIAETDHADAQEKWLSQQGFVAYAVDASKLHKAEEFMDTNANIKTNANTTANMAAKVKIKSIIHTNAKDEIESDVQVAAKDEIKSDIEVDTESDKAVNQGETKEVITQTKGKNVLPLAESLLDPIENTALTYTRTTTKKTVVDKVYAVALSNLDILETPPEVKKSDDETVNHETVNHETKEEKIPVIGTLKKGGLCYLLADKKEEWVYVESADVRGFVEKKKLLTGKKAKNEIKEKGEDRYLLAEEQRKPKENKMLYYTLTSVKEGKVASAIRASIVEYALRFVGNSYVWGGTSLTAGADCSGYVQSIYRDYGYALPRVAEDQAQYGRKIPVEEAQPGDLIYYAKAGYIYHVVMYIGDGKVVQAASTSQGIITSGIDSANAVWATSIVTDTDDETIRYINEKAGQEQALEHALASQIGGKMGTFKLTAYCSCAICCGQWANGITASGTKTTQGRTVAMGGMPFGTKLIINGQIYTVEDRGTPYGHVDIYMDSHEEAIVFGVQYADVYQMK